MSSHSCTHYRQSHRLNGYDYSGPGAYFVTICTFKGRNLFGEIHNREMFLNDAGRIVERTWLEIPEHFLIADLDSFIVMPNHIHGILVLIDVGRGTAHLQTNAGVPCPYGTFWKSHSGVIAHHYSFVQIRGHKSNKRPKRHKEDGCMAAELL